MQLPPATRSRSATLLPLGALLILGLGAASHAQAPDAAEPSSTRALQGERLPATAFGPSTVESMEEALRRAELTPLFADPKCRGDAHGEWAIPGRRDGARPASGAGCVINGWGDTRLGLGFEAEVNLRGVWIARHGADGAEARAVRALGYRDGELVARTAWREELPDAPTWWELDLAGIDRVVFTARAALRGAGWFSLDDLTFDELAEGGERVERTRVVDFEGLPQGTRLTGSGYFGLTWERGSGDFGADAHATAPTHGVERGAKEEVSATAGPNPTAGGGAVFTGPAPEARAGDLVPGFGFAGPTDADVGTLGVPDTNGAVGPDHYVAAPNGHLAVYDRVTGQELLEIAQTAFWSAPGTLGDPRIAFDPHSERFILLASDWSARLYLAVSLTSDPTGAWFKTSFAVNLGADAGKWPDYPSLGLDANGIYTGMVMAPSGFGTITGTVIAIDKAPLVAASPSLGAVTAWRQLPNDWAIQGAVTYGDAGGGYFVSTGSTPEIRLRQVVGPLTAPTLVELGLVDIPPYSPSPDAPQLGSSVKLGTGSSRLMNAVVRDGSVWTVHDVNVGGRAGARWYQIDPVAATLVQSGDIGDPVRSFFMPSIAVNAAGDMVVGCTGSSPSEHAGAWAVGRRASDPQGEMRAPVLLKAGTSPHTFMSFGGVTRWGDYSLTGVDPLDDLGFWTIQEYAASPTVWATWVQAVGF